MAGSARDDDIGNVAQSSNVVIRWLRQFGSSIGIGTPPEYDLVKRIIAVGGQTVQCCNAQHQTLVDGKPLNEPYVHLQPGTESYAYEPFGPITIPEGDLWMEGDNRGNSDDSRHQNGGGLNGVVPVGNVIGVARSIIWPPSRWRGIGETNPPARGRRPRGHVESEVRRNTPACAGTTPLF